MCDRSVLGVAVNDWLQCPGSRFSGILRCAVAHRYCHWHLQSVKPYASIAWQ
jgi:hypothetical protein